jgi:hypothetical protein
MKIVFEESDINTALIALNQLKVEGVTQAGILLTINRMLQNGESMESETKDQPEDKKGE